MRRGAQAGGSGKEVGHVSQATLKPMGPGMGGMGHGDRRAGRPADPLGGAAPKPKVSQSERLRELWPDIKELIMPRRGIFALGFVLMLINRLCALVLPSSTTAAPADNVIGGKRQVEQLAPIVGAVLAATLIQGLTFFSPTQLKPGRWPRNA